MTSTTHANEETFAGRTLKFTIPSRDARGRLVRLDSSLDEILSVHDYPAPITHLLAEALVLITLMGSLVKDDGSQVTMQAQTEAGEPPPRSRTANAEALTKPNALPAGAAESGPRASAARE